MLDGRRKGARAVTVLSMSALAAILGLLAAKSPAAAQTTLPYSINSTAQNKPAGSNYPAVQPVTPTGTSKGYSVIVSNDLGMHCADFDARIATILPLFNVLHAQVVKQGSTPTILDNNTVNVQYSATYNRDDPVGKSTQRILATDGSQFKTNFWDNISAYKSFYPTATFLATYFPAADSPTASKNYDVGLMVPDLYNFYLGTKALTFTQQPNSSVTAFYYNPTTPLVSVTSAAYVKNSPQYFRTFEPAFPMFTTKAFGYAAQNTKWFAAEGVPVAAFDDYGRENPFAMMRVEAVTKGSTPTTVASTDVVIPVGGETNCKGCHLPAGSAGSTGSATTRTLAWMKPENDPSFGKVPAWVSEEWAADVNILKLHDAMHTLTINGANAKLFNGFDANGKASPPIACQTCHYTPALDLAQMGPQGTDLHPAGYVAPPAGSTILPQGLMQLDHETMSRVMHYSHAKKANPFSSTQPLFASMPSPSSRTLSRTLDTKPNTTPYSTVSISNTTKGALDNSCYQCHPGKRTQCLRGTMFSRAGSVCQDCHGNMEQIGADFSQKVLSTTVHSDGWTISSDYYTSASTPRVPWLNEPTCGSCHTGDANSNFAKTPPTGKSVIAYQDSIRLLQAWYIGDANAKPIIPTNKRFAEPVVTTGPATGNPQLFRLSVDTHGGVFCEGCHGATHAEWPVIDGSSPHNDNVTTMQLQGHAGKIVECSTCHTGTSMPVTLKGPHGMHPVGNNGFSASWTSGHEDFAQQNMAECKACHGTSGQGTTLGDVAVTRANLKCKQTGPRAGMPVCSNEQITLPAGYRVTCDTCHQNYVTQPSN